MFRLCSPLILAFIAHAAMAGPDGVLRVIDGDTYEIAGETVRLYGIDALETAQTCTTDQGGIWECGAWTTLQVRMLYQGRRAQCDTVDIDRYGRSVATCTVDGVDMGRAIVRAGLATAYRRYSMAYDLDEKAAAVAGIGIWSAQFETPATHRETQRADNLQGATPVDVNCVIKGNISRSGRIYHMPHNRDYDRTGINPANGERWFCTEAEARAAGWRAARN